MASRNMQYFVNVFFQLQITEKLGVTQMLRKLSAVFFLFTVLFPIGATNVIAQTQTKEEKKAIEVEQKLEKMGTGERVRVKVKLYSGTQYEGYLSFTNEDDFIVVDKAGKPNTIKYTEVKSIGGKNLATGVKIGIGIGIGALATLLIIIGIIYASDS